MRIYRIASTPNPRCLCATCGTIFACSHRAYQIRNDHNTVYGLICATCFAADPPALRQRMRRYAYLIRLHPRQTAWEWTRVSPNQYARELDALAADRTVRYPGLPGWWRNVRIWWQSLKQRP
jgi:hypothetical protein